jgi:hypothetical protein
MFKDCMYNLRKESRPGVRRLFSGVLRERRANKIHVDFEPPCVGDLYPFVSVSFDRKGSKRDLKYR